MGKLIKTLIWVVGAAVGLLLVLILAVVFLFDPNDYREDLAAGLSEATGRTVSLDGDLTLSVFPWFAVETRGVTVSNADGFGDEPMLSIGQAKAGVKLAGLFSGRLDVDTITIRDLDLKLAVDSRGIGNWQDLAGGSDPDIEGPSDTGAPPISIAGLIIENARVAYRDKATGAQYLLESFDLSVDSVDFERPVAVRSEFSFASVADDASGRMALQSTIRFSRDGDGPVTGVAFTDTRIEGDVSHPAVPGEKPIRFDAESISAGVGDNTALALQGGRLDVLGLTATLSLAGQSTPLAVDGTIDVAPFSPREVMQAATGEPLLLTDPEAMTTARLTGELSVTDNSASLKSLKLDIDATSLTGELSLKDFGAPAIRFDLAGTTINLDGYLPPADASVADDAGDNLAETALPVDLIQGLNARGRFRMQQVVFGELPFDDLDLSLNVSGDRARLQPMTATVLEGRYTGDVTIDASTATPRLSLNETVEGLNMGALASLLYDKDNIEGVLAGQFRLAGRGSKLSEIRSSLNGDVSFSLTDGALTGTDIWHNIRRARAVFNKEAVPPAPQPLRTEFTELKGTATVRDGVARNDDLFAALPFLQVTGSGSVDLGEGTIDYTANARVLERPEFLDDIDEAELDEYTEAVIPMRITGPMAQPDIRPDVAGMLRAAAERKAREAIDDKLKDRLKDKEDELKKRLKDIF